LASVTTHSGTDTYQYNALGQRVEKTVGGTTTVFVYDETGHLIGEYTPSGTLIAEHIWLNNRPIGVITSSGLYYVHTDQLGTPRVITNSSKTIVWQWNSDPFGNSAPTGSLTYNLRFPGQYYDAETGLNYNLNRNYNPNIGRYVESDPIGLGGGANTYAYTGDNSLKYDDPTGQAVYIYSDQVTTLTSPPSDHLYILLVPDNPQDFSNVGGFLPLGNGGLWGSLSAHPEFDLFGNLAFTPNYPGNDFGGEYRATVKPPCGETDTQFIRNLIIAADKYGNNLPYSYPDLPSGHMAPGEYNSNSFISGIILQTGAELPSLPNNSSYQVPGYQNPIP